MNHDMCVNIEEVEKVVEARAKLSEAQNRGEFALLHQKLDNILTQTTKTNGSVAKLKTDVRNLEEESRSHASNCPHSEEIRILKDKAITNDAIVKTVWKGIGILAGVITFLMTVFAFIAGYIG